MVSNSRNKIHKTWEPVFGPPHSAILEILVKDGHLIYPGDDWCNPQQPHSKWHLQSGIGLLDLVYLCDNMYQLTGSQ